MDVSITKISSKGQVVIPLEMRADFSEGEKLMIIKDRGRLIMKKATSLDKTFLDDIEFAKNTEKAWKEYEKGNFKALSSNALLDKLKKW